MEKADILSTFFTSFFTGKSNLQQSQVSETGGTVRKAPGQVGSGQEICKQIGHTQCHRPWFYAHRSDEVARWCHFGATLSYLWNVVMNGRHSWRMQGSQHHCYHQIEQGGGPGELQAGQPHPSSSTGNTFYCKNTTFLLTIRTCQSPNSVTLFGYFSLFKQVTE